jgi:hypothetical protein
MLLPFAVQLASERKFWNMTPEERLDNIERTLQRTAEMQAEQSNQIRDLIADGENQNEAIRSLIADGEKQNEAIRSLIVVSRTVLTSIQELRTVQDKMIEEARERDKHTVEKLNILIDTVDRIIRSRRKNGDTA